MNKRGKLKGNGSVVMKTVALVAALGLFTPLLNAAEETNQRQPRIAVIGAGASGLTAAYMLKKQGYQRVVVFEKESSVGGVAHTEWIDGKPYDMSTMFVPGGTIAGDGIQPVLKEMILSSKEKLIPAVDFETLNLPSLELTTLNKFHQGFEPEELTRQLFTGLNLMTKWASCLANNIDSVTCGISLPDQPDETIQSWGERNGVPAFLN